MSMNFTIRAKRTIQVVSTGKFETQHVYPEVYQTPSAVTYELLSQVDPLTAYFNWVLNTFSKDEEVPVYADDDIFGESPPIRVEVVNHAKDHVKELVALLATLRSEGYEIEYTDI